MNAGPVATTSAAPGALRGRADPPASPVPEDRPSRATRWRARLVAVAPAAAVAALGGEAAARLAPGDPVLLVLALLQSLPLVARHRAPRAVLALTVAAAATQLLLGYPSTNAVVGQYVAAVAVAQRLPRWRSAAPPALCLAVWIAAAAAGAPPTLPLVMVEAITALVAWAFADAVRRRRQVAAALTADLARLEWEQGISARTAALDERLRIGRDLHLVVGKALDAIVLQAGLGRTLLSSDPEAGAREIGRIEEVGRQTLAEMDRFLGLLRARSPAPEPAPRGASPALPTSLPQPGALWRRATLVAPTALLAPLALLEVLAAPGDDAALRPVLVAFVLLQTLPLLLRGWLPGAVLVAVTTAAAVPLALGHPVGNGVVAVPVAVHALASRGPRRLSLLASVGAFLVVTAAAAPTGVAEVWQLVVVVGSFCAAAWFIGDAERLAARYRASLQDRAAQIHRERELHVARAVAQERVEIARDLHDSVGHTVSLAVLQAGAARLAAATGTAGAAEALQSIETAGRSALADMGRSTALLPDAPADALAPPPRLTDLVGLVDGMRAAGLRIELVFAGRSAGLPVSMEASAFRVVQEALTNVAKHAPGATTRVGVRHRRGWLEVEVCDDGAADGSRPPALTSGGRGQVGMRERVELFGGDLVCGPRPGRGYRVLARFPVSADHEEAP